ncbi:MAG: hypothetical protein ACRDRZ_07705 [Pseudonocardiaceae bacterium]
MQDQEEQDQEHDQTVFDARILLLIGGLAVAVFLVGVTIGGGSSATTTANLTITSEAAGGLEPGARGTFNVLINNPEDDGVRVTSISAGRSNPTAGGCPAGTVTSAPVTDPAGYIGPSGLRAYPLTVTMAADPGKSCQGQSFTLPLTVELESA